MGEGGLGRGGGLRMGGVWEGGEVWEVKGKAQLTK